MAQERLCFPISFSIRFEAWLSVIIGVGVCGYSNFCVLSECRLCVGRCDVILLVLLWMMILLSIWGLCRQYGLDHLVLGSDLLFWLHFLGRSTLHNGFWLWVISWRVHHCGWIIEYFRRQKLTPHPNLSWDDLEVVLIIPLFTWYTCSVTMIMSSVTR